MRKRRAVKRDILPDPIYKSKVVAKLINTIMLDGKKGIAQTIVYEAFDIVKNKTGKDPIILSFVIKGNFSSSLKFSFSSAIRPKTITSSLFTIILV